MFYRTIRIIALISFFAATSIMGESFQVETAHSSVKFKIKCMVLGHVAGEFDHFYGRFNIKRGILMSFNAKCYSNSINTGNPKRDKDLKSANFFNVTHYPKLTLQMVELKKDIMLINLTIKGITKLVAFDYRADTKMKNLQGSHRVGFSLKGRINLKDFDLNLHSTLGSRSLVLGKTVKIVAEIEGVESSAFVNYSANRK